MSKHAFSGWEVGRTLSVEREKLPLSDTEIIVMSIL